MFLNPPPDQCNYSDRAKYKQHIWAKGRCLSSWRGFESAWILISIRNVSFSAFPIMLPKANSDSVRPIAPGNGEKTQSV